MGRLEPEGRDYDFDTDAERDRELEERKAGDDLLREVLGDRSADNPDGS